ncbi:MAG: hypothetical protein K2Q06_04005, partial [Parvularculaceae bacterium]|nr:hypothetical protein [Parvularculaceae bacterium]
AWGRVTAFMSLLIAVATLGVVFYQANLMRQQTRAATWPYLSVQSSASATEFKFIVTNSGVGPARLESVTVAIDGKPVRNWDEALSMLIGEKAQGYSYSEVSGYVFAPQESRIALVVENPELLQKLLPQIRMLSGTICYCSVLDECTLSRTIAERGLDRDRDAAAGDRCAAQKALVQFEN